MQNQRRWTITGLLFLGALFSAFAQISIRSEKDGNRDEWVMNQSDDGRGLRIRVKGRLEFNDEYSDVKSLTPNGSLQVKDTRSSVARRLEIEADGQGNLKRTYFVNDRAQTLDVEGRQWVAEMLLEMVRQGGYDAERRVARLLAQGGANAVLQEISRIRGSYAKSIYFRHLLKQPNLDTATVPRIVQQIARELSSAYEKRQALGAVAEKHLNEAAVLNELIAAIGTIDSDYERGQMMGVFLNGSKLTDAQLQAALQVISGIGSAYEKSQALLRVAKSQKLASAALPQLFAAINSISSDYEKARVLLAFLKDEGTDPEMMKRVITASAAIGSDYEQARVLLRVAALNKDNEEIRKLLVEASRTIGSDYERGRVLTATFR